MAERTDHSQRRAARAASLELGARRGERVPGPTNVRVGGEALGVGHVVVEVHEQDVAVPGRHDDERLARDRPARQPGDRGADAVGAVQERVGDAVLVHHALESAPARCHLGVAETRVGLRPGAVP
jgi:hypothetical protein